VTRKPSGPKGRMQKDRAETFMMNCKRQVTRKPSGPIGRMEMEKGPTGTRTRKPLGPTSQMEKGPTGTRCME